MGFYRCCNPDRIQVNPLHKIAQQKDVRITDINRQDPRRRSRLPIRQLPHLRRDINPHLDHALHIRIPLTPPILAPRSGQAPTPLDPKAPNHHDPPRRQNPRSRKRRLHGRHIDIAVYATVRQLLVRGVYS